MNSNKLYKFVLVACLIGYIWLFFSLYHQNEIHSSQMTVCFIKKTTNVPCPSCGTTRAVMHLFQGDVISSILINPFGILVGLIMITAPIWIGIDYIQKKDTFFQFYKKSEQFISQKWIAVFLVTLVLLNWYWNIKKGL
jgi:hypothetical protein